MIDGFPDRLAVLQIHVPLGQTYDGYETGWGESRGDDFYLGVNDRIPVLMYDGDLESPLGYYTDDLQDRLDEPTDVTIDLWAQQVRDELWVITAEVCVEADGNGKGMRVYAAQVLDHFPSAPSYSRNCLRQVAPTRDVEVAAGACSQTPFTFEFDAESWTNNQDIKIVVWAQDVADQGPAQVHQAAKMTWPFPEPPPPDPRAPRRPMGRVSPFELPPPQKQLR